MAIAVDCMLTSLKKYETAESSVSVLTDLKAILELGQAPFFNMFIFCGMAYRSFAVSSFGQENSLSGSDGRALQAATLSRMTSNSLRIIKCLHGVDLPEFFEENLSQLSSELVQLVLLQACNIADEAAQNMPDDPSELQVFKACNYCVCVNS